jgi:anti-sigma factor RsiW
MKGPDFDHDHRCTDFLERLSRYLDDELPEAERSVIEHHLRDCPCCGDVLDSLKFTLTACHEKGRPALPRDVRQRARERVAELLRQAPRRKPGIRG